MGQGTTATLLAWTGRAGGGAAQVGAYFDGDGAGAIKVDDGNGGVFGLDLDGDDGSGTVRA